MERQLIIEIEAKKADYEAMVREVARATGDSNPFFCPAVKEGEAYQGHVHVFPPIAATNVAISIIIVPESKCLV